MEYIARDLTELVGHTPLLEASRFCAARGLCCRLLCKLESLNPAGSVKDRVALAMLRQAEREGKISPGATIIEPTSGNTGIGLAAMGAVLGYRVLLTMPGDHEPGAPGPPEGLRRPAGADRGFQGHGRGPLKRPGSWRPSCPAASSPASLKTRPIPRPTTIPPARSCGNRPAASWTFSWRARAPAAP